MQWMGLTTTKQRRTSPPFITRMSRKICFFRAVQCYSTSQKKRKWCFLMTWMKNWPTTNELQELLVGWGTKATTNARYVYDIYLLFERSNWLRRAPKISTFFPIISASFLSFPRFKNSWEKEEFISYI